LGLTVWRFFCGLIRTTIGTDTNVDLLQLASCGTHSTEVKVILSMHPEWDWTPRRIKLPAIASSGGLNSNHIKPVSWTGNLDISSTNFLTSGRMGRRGAEEIIDGSAQHFTQLAKNPKISPHAGH
jgi:hypothetical protein